MMRARPAGAVFWFGWREESRSEGVDDRQNSCMMCGSLGHLGVFGNGQGAEAGPQGSLTVCAGDLCGRLVSGPLSIADV